SSVLSRQPAGEERPIGGSVVAGITHAIRSPYLVNVSLFLLLFAITSTFLYFQQAGIVSQSFADRGAQTAFFATIDLVVNTLTLVVQLFFTGRLLVLFGVALALAFLPLLTMIGFGALVFAPTLTAITVFQVLRRAGDYAAGLGPRREARGGEPPAARPPPPSPGKASAAPRHPGAPLPPGGGREGGGGPPSLHLV